MYSRILILLAVLVGIVPICQAKTIGELFVDEPGYVIPLLDKRVKMDMIDYQKEGIGKVFNNALGSGSYITSSSDNHISLQVTKSSQVELMLIANKKDSVILAISTVDMPAKDSRVECFNTKWEKVDEKKYFKAVEMKDFIKIPKGDKTKKESVLDAIEFPIIWYSLDLFNGRCITAHHGMKEYMSEEDYKKISPYLVNEIKIKIK